MADSEGTFSGNGSVNWALNSKRSIRAEATNNGNTLRHQEGTPNDRTWNISGIDETLPPAFNGQPEVIQESAANTLSANSPPVPSFAVTIELPLGSERTVFLRQLSELGSKAEPDPRFLKIRFYLPIVGKRTKQISVKWETVE